MIRLPQCRLVQRRLLATTALVVAAAGVAGAGVGVAVAGTRHGAVPNGRYGGLPSYLPKDSLRTDGAETGSVRRPALTSEGDAIVADLPHGGSAVVTVSGPTAPGEGLPFQAKADTATWTVTIAHATRRIPLSVKAFSMVDSQGASYHPYLVPGQPRLPARLRPGQYVRFQLRAVMRTGEGTMRWAPLGNDLLASWDFTLEND